MNVPTSFDVDATFAPSRQLFQRLFERVYAFIADVPNANERANAAVKALEIIRLERSFYPSSPDVFSAPSLDAWRRRVETALTTVQDAISAVESRAERAYLRRLALDATLALNACDETFFTETLADALLAEIDDAEERQNALVDYSARLAARIRRFPKSAAPKRAKAFELTEEIEDLRLFERAAATVVAAVLFNATQCNDAPTVATLASLDLTPFGDDVAETWEQFESCGGFLELCERATADAFAVRPGTTPTPQEIALRQAFNAETRRRLERILSELDSGVADDGSTLNEEETAERQTVVDEAVIASPFALENGEFFRAFLERSRNLGAFFPIFERLAEATQTTAALDDSATSCFRSFYRADAEFFAAEKTRWLESARRVASQSLDVEADPRVKLDRLTTSAELEFRFGDKTAGQNAVREMLTFLPRLESAFERARFYRRLVALHVASSYPKAAQKLAALWKAELDAIEPEDLRDAAVADAFALYMQAVKLDAAAISEIFQTIAAPLVRLACETRFQLALHFAENVASGTADADFIAKITNLVDSTVNAVATFDELAPDEAVWTVANIARELADRLAATFPPLN